MHLGQAVRINHCFNGCYSDSNGQSLSFMNYASTKSTKPALGLYLWTGSGAAGGWPHD